jgi:hypothetical protein
MPQEMEELTKDWKPYRSLGRVNSWSCHTKTDGVRTGVYYMWTLSEGNDD